MPTYYLLDEAEKNTVFKIREGLKHLTEYDYDKIFKKANNLFREWSQPSVRGQMLMPQDCLDYWIMVATYEYTLERLGIKL
jgi:hypothetical protein